MSEPRKVVRWDLEWTPGVVFVPGHLNPYYTDVEFVGANTGWLGGVGRGGFVLRTRDGAGTWAKVLDTQEKIKDICFVDPSTGWAVGSDGTVETTRDGGESWEHVFIHSVRNFNGVAFAGRDHGWIVGHLESIVHTEDAGSTWVWQREGLEFYLMAVAFLDTLSGWAVGSHYGTKDNGLILRTTDGGADWYIQQTTPHSLFKIRFGDNGRGWIMGSSAIYATEDGGETWNQATIDSLITTVNDVAFVDDQSGWAVGYFGRVWQTEDGGRTWQYIDSFGSGYSLRDFQAIGFSDPYNAWIVGSTAFVGHMRRVPVYED